ncbi:MAG: MotA/TolQ/ExbB proton channel family protein [Kiritimatiellaceae bacterium]|nr:MotA/TolQ/ExbB proton channel family protein [Kiritimatiellaceae bacterium]
MFDGIYDKIGMAGVVLAFLPLFSLYFFIQPLIYLAWVPRGFRTFCAAFEKPAPAVTESQARCNPLSSVLWDVLKHQTPRGEVQEEVQYLFQRTFGRTYVAVTVLRLISVISPLLGLYGTVLGMSKVFREIGAKAVAVDQSVLANGIWEALITTIMGLTIAIPTLVFYYLVRLRIRSLMIECIETARDLQRSSK